MKKIIFVFLSILSVFNYANAKDFFLNITDQIAENEFRLSYGVSVTDVNKDNKYDFVVTGFGFKNLALSYKDGKLINIVNEKIFTDEERRTIGVAACDIDQDGYEEIYFLNTDTYSGSKIYSDRLIDLNNNKFEDLFEKEINQNELNLTAGRSVVCVDRNGDGAYGIYVANYGGPTRFYELIRDRIKDQAKLLSIDKITGDGKAFFKDNPQRPIGVQRETTIEDIEAHVADAVVDDEYQVMNAQGLRKEKLKPIDWVIPGMVPRCSTVSLGGTSNVGKTRWLAALAVSLSVGNTKRMGLPQIDTAHPTLWIANEERADDIKRRLKAVMLQHNDKKSADIVVRGKDKGTARLIALNEIGTPELDQKSIASIVAQARRVDAAIIILDPYITLSEAVDENSAVSAGMLTKAFILKMCVANGLSEEEMKALVFIASKQEAVRVRRQSSAGSMAALALNGVDDVVDDVDAMLAGT